eukprot:1176553-Prorocentrum_minimum.AAC.8
MSWYITERYHPIQAGSIDGVDTTPHDRAVKRAVRAQRDKLYDSCQGELDDKGDPHLTLFIGRVGTDTGTVIGCVTQLPQHAPPRLGFTRLIDKLVNVLRLGEEDLHNFFTPFGRVKRVRLVRDLVTGESRGYAYYQPSQPKVYDGSSLQRALVLFPVMIYFDITSRVVVDNSILICV